MLRGDRVELSLIRERDLDACWEAQANIANRGGFFNGGRNHDVLLYSLLRSDPRPWQT